VSTATDEQTIVIVDEDESVTLTDRMIDDITAAVRPFLPLLPDFTKFSDTGSAATSNVYVATRTINKEDDGREPRSPRQVNEMLGRAADFLQQQLNHVLTLQFLQKLEQTLRSWEDHCGAAVNRQSGLVDVIVQAVMEHRRQTDPALDYSSPSLQLRQLPKENGQTVARRLNLAVNAAIDGARIAQG
jgi:hypothetical protein